MGRVETDKRLDSALELEVEVKPDGTVKMIFPSLDEVALTHLLQSLPQLQGDIAQGDAAAREDRRGAPKLIEERSKQVEERMDRLETKMTSLVQLTEKVTDSLSPLGGRRKDEVRIPSRGTKYNDVLRELTLRYGSAPFESTCVPESQRHILSILNNRYNALRVVDNRGRTNIYGVKEEIVQAVFSEEGECVGVEIRGKPREVVERALKTNKDSYPKFSYFYKDGAGQRHRYTLIFGDATVKVSVMENLSRSVGNHRNMKIFSEEVGRGLA
jgi:hypothetical protein